MNVEKLQNCWSLLTFVGSVAAFKLLSLSCQQECNVDGFSTVTLSKTEGLYLNSPPINSVTFYEGSVPSVFIRKRLTETILLNPWLMGRLLRINGKIAIRFPLKPDLQKLPILEIELPDFSANLGFVDEFKMVEKYLVKIGYQCLGNDEELFRVVVVKISPNKFAVIFSMSHAHADGHTFYSIQHMFSSVLSPRAMIVERCYTFADDLAKLSNYKHKTWSWLLSPGVFVSIFVSILLGKRGVFNLFTLNEAYIEQRKRNYVPAETSAVKFISSNDIITSEFFATGNCDVVLMAVNFRNRIPHITPDHAGNYEDMMALQREDFQTPQAIRQALLLNHAAYSSDLPGFWRSQRGLRIGLISTWATFYRDVTLPDCKQLLHRPLVLEALTPFEQAALLFRFNEKEMGIVTICKDSGVLGKMGMLKDLVF